MIYINKLQRQPKLIYGLRNQRECDSAIPLLGTQPKGIKSVSRRDICIPMLIALLFTIAKTWKQPKCPSMDKWIYIHTQWNIMQP